MTKKRINQIVFYTRPWEVYFHIELAKQLSEKYPDVPILFVSFFTAACRTVQDAGFEILYFPDELAKVSGDELSEEQFSQIDQSLYNESGANYNLMLHSERFLPQDAREAEIFGKKHLVVLDRLVMEGTLSICSMYDHFVYWLAGGLANARGGWHFAFVGCGVPAGRTIALKTPWETWNPGMVSEKDAAFLLKDSREALNLPAEERISYMKKQPRRKKSFSERWKMHKDIQFDRDRGNYFTQVSITIPQWLMIRLLPSRIYNKVFRFPEPVYDFQEASEVDQYDASFVYLPLHMEPEAVILMYSPWLRDQLEVIRLAAQALPVGWKLLVKENPKMRGCRSPEFNKTLTSIPNVRLVSPTLPSMNLIRKAKATVVLAGTSGIEARLLDKPVYYMGVPPFRSLLTLGDIASSSFGMKKFFAQLDAKNHQMDFVAWREWVSGTVQGDVVPVSGKVDSSSDNVSVFVEYIVDCLRIG